MQHNHSSTLPSEVHSGFWRILKYLFPAGVGILAIMEWSPALLILLAISSGLILALSQRLKNLDRQAATDFRATSGRLFGDGGCFPCDTPETERSQATLPPVLDGGSLEHNRRE